MDTLSLALYCEGSTDSRFLRPIIRETSTQVLLANDRSDVEVLSVEIMLREVKEQREAILAAARKARDYHALIIHADADDPQPYKARSERYDPGYTLVQQTQEDICKDLLPIIPVQAIEAWMMADYELLLTEIGTDLSPVDLHIPVSASHVETLTKPKMKLKQAVQIAYASRSRRRRDTDIDFLYEPVGERINLERLKLVPSYNRFVSDLTATLRQLDFID